MKHKSQVDHHALFEHVYTHAPIGIALVSIDGMWLKANPALCSVLGYSDEELVRLSFGDITHPDDLEVNKEFIRGLLDGTTFVYETEKRYIHKNGSDIWASLHVSLVRDEQDGTPLYFIAHVIDITEKKAVENKLIEVEQLFNLISEHALDIISYMTPDGITRYCSPSVRDLLGYEPEEVIGKNNLQFYHPEDMAQLMSKPILDHNVFTYRVLHKNGYYVWFESTTKIVRDARGQIQIIIGIGRDVTERKKYEDSLAEAQRIALLGSWEWDIHSEAMFLSDQVYEILQLDKNRQLSQPGDLLGFVHPHDQRHVLVNVRQAYKRGELNFEFRNILADKSVKYLHIRGTVNFSENGSPISMNGTIQDISERKSVELKLQESIERYTSLKKYNHDAIISLDLEGVIMNTNAMAEQLTGYSVNEMIGMNLSRFIGETNLRRLLSGSEDSTLIEKDIDRIERIDGRYAEVLTTIAPIIINKEMTGYYIIVKDITAQKKLLIEKEAAENTNKAKSEFLAMMSHEIRTPMNGVIGMTDLLLDTPDLTDEQKDYVQIISKSGNTLLNLINDILDFSKIESGKTEFLEEPFNVSETIEEALDVLMSKAREKDLKMTVSVSPDVPRRVIGDSKRLRQVLLNIIGNAIKFTYTGGVTIFVEKMGNHDHAVKLQFTIKDTGIGIPEEKLGNLFEPFYQLDHFMTRKSEGTGLGLAISRKLVELMGGEIWIERQADSDEQGATFMFTVSFSEEEEPVALKEPSEAQGEQHNIQPLKILIAEDHKVNQIVMQKMLNKMGHMTSLSENGSEVIRAVAYETYDIIFMDVQMPIMDGVEATKVIKETLPPERRPYIVAVTANALNGDREKYMAAGMDEYISKPIKSIDVVGMIEKYRELMKLKA